jgi:pimeloyl-ACP methyl ester carboxylesterase
MVKRVITFQIYGHTGSVPATEQFIEVADGVQLRALDYGEATATGPVFVLVHGLASNALLWQGVASSLAERGYRAVSIDLRGHGRSSKPDGPYDVPTVANDVAALLRSLGIEGSIVAGQSWGGNVVIELAAQHGDAVRAVVPVDGGFIDLSAQFDSWEACSAALAPPRFAGTPASQFEGWMRSAHPEWPETGISGMMGNVELHDDGTISPWLSYEHHLDVLRGLYEHRPVDRYGSIAVPVWWMVAGDPEPVSAEAGSWNGNKHDAIDVALSKLSIARSTWFAGADHDLHAQYPKRVADLLISGVNEGWM